MNKYRVDLFNDCKCLIYSDEIFAENENKAIKEMLEEVDLASGDTIVIEEIY